MPYFSTKVAVTYTDDNGKEKVNKENWIVDAQSVTEAEAHVNSIYKDSPNHFRVVGTSEMNVQGIIEYDTNTKLVRVR